ncbi:MAG: acyl dehydratase [Candidatus Marinimicrobia bacterium]|nr:acyl dehydratase [Candidatus Neomarinimicrobiota bacterium]|tara:strand:- start:2112 stop:2549 length:438 start_codon:yes stop_codon:yes gene_type:complete
MLDRSLINKNYPTVKFDVEKQRLKFFAKATGQTDPIYFDEIIAREKGFPSILAPPTFLTTVAYEQNNPNQYIYDLSVNMKDVLHAGQIYKYHSLVFAGDIITMDSKIKDMYDKKNGSLEFVEFESLYTNQNGKLVVESLSTLVIR